MSMIQIPDSDISAYRSDPLGPPRGAIIVIHEIWGLVDHIKSVADRFAAEGYLAIAPDILSNAGLTPAAGQELHDLAMNPDEAVRTEAQPLMREKLAAAREPDYGAWAIAQLRMVVDFLELQPGIDGRLAVTGFCFGGSYAFALAAAEPRLKAAAPFYGAPPEESDISSIECPVYALYGSLDVKLMESLPQVTAAMKKANINFESKVYDGARHAFFNDTNALTYDSSVAEDAWTRVLEFIAKSLS